MLESFLTNNMFLSMNKLLILFFYRGVKQVQHRAIGVSIHHPIHPNHDYNNYDYNYNNNYNYYNNFNNYNIYNNDHYNNYYYKATADEFQNNTRSRKSKFITIYSNKTIINITMRVKEGCNLHPIHTPLP